MTMLDGTVLKSGDKVIVHAHGKTEPARFLGVGAKSQKVYVAFPDETVEALALTDEHWLADPATDRAYTFGDPEILDTETPDRE